MKVKLNLSAFYPHSPERVWRALTESDAVSQWLMPTDLKPVVGSRFRFEDGAMEVTGEVLIVDPEKALIYTWDDGESGSPSVVAWTLHPKDGGTELRLDHEALPVEEPLVLIEASANWGYRLGTSLPALLGLPPVPIVYVADEPEQAPKLARAGFRQSEEAVCR